MQPGFSSVFKKVIQMPEIKSDDLWSYPIELRQLSSPSERQKKSSKNLPYNERPRSSTSKKEVLALFFQKNPSNRHLKCREGAENFRRVRQLKKTPYTRKRKKCAASGTFQSPKMVFGMRFIVQIAVDCIVSCLKKRLALFLWFPTF